MFKDYYTTITYGNYYITIIKKTIAIIQLLLFATYSDLPEPCLELVALNVVA